MPKSTTPLWQRFLLRVTPGTKDECWEWTGAKRHYGHGQIREFGAGSRTICASRLAYELFIGPIPHGLVVRHTCDNPGCVNPEHLALGTQADNMRDKVERGRQAKGSRTGQAKLTEREANLIKQFLLRHPPRMGGGGGQCLFLAGWFGVHISIVSAIGKGKIWTHA